MTPSTRTRLRVAAGVAMSLFAVTLLVLWWQTREDGPWSSGVGPLGPPPTVTGAWPIAEWWADRIGAVALVGALGFVGVFWRLHRVKRSPPGPRCKACGYDLAGLTGPLCPECGHTPAQLSPEPREWKRDEGFWRDERDTPPQH